MIIPIENKCIHCNKIFCCPKCRVKHELKMHAVNVSSSVTTKLTDDGTTYTYRRQFQSCPLCTDKKQLLLQRIHSEQLLEHISATHLPLRCNKCLKIFRDKSDFNGPIPKCHGGPCTLDNIESNQMSVAPSTDQKNIESNAQQIAVEVNQRWKEKIDPNNNNITKVTTHPSPIQNDYGNKATPATVAADESSSSAVLHRTVSPLQPNNLRPTSTPMPMDSAVNGGSENLSIGGKHSFGGSISSSYQISSIHSPGNLSEAAFSPLPPHQPPINRNKSQMQSEQSSPRLTAKPRVRNKLPPSATPLRQVMSKSIQKAIQQHGGHPDMIFRSASTSKIGSPLDLRTSPVIRRTSKSEGSPSGPPPSTKSNVRRLPVFSKHYQKLPTMMTTKKLSFSNASGCSSSSESSLDTVYETCQDSSSMFMHHLSTAASGNISASVGNLPSMMTTVASDGTGGGGDMCQTPKTGGILKKTASFADNINAIQHQREVDDDDADVWETPRTLPRSFSCTHIHETRHTYRIESHQSNYMVDDEVFRKGNNGHASTIGNHHRQPQQCCAIEATGIQRTGSLSSSLWSLVSTVMRFAPFGSKDRSQSVAALLQKDDDTFSRQRRQSSSDDDPAPTSKRRRTNTVDDPSCCVAGGPKRIIGRPPLQRMQKTEYAEY